jgi:L-asparaginase
LIAARLPRVSVLSAGGTIASVGPSGSAVPTLSAGELVAAVPELETVADVSASSARQLPSGDIRIADLLDLARLIQREVETGARGVVITQGTDTMEESAFALDLLVDVEVPVVVTGAMRHPDLPGADGPANLLAAVRVATARAARRMGVLVVMNDQIHAARYVRKMHTTSPAAFRSPLAGPVGWITEGRPRLAARPFRSLHVSVPAGAPTPPVALVKVALGDDGRLVDALPGLGYQGVVIEALGGGHVPNAMVEPLERLALEMPVVLASRTGSGENLRATYGHPGSETDLLARGLVSAYALDGLKSRVLLTLLLMAGTPRADIAERFVTAGLP